MASSATSLPAVSLMALVRLPFRGLRSSHMSSSPCLLLHQAGKLPSPSRLSPRSGGSAVATSQRFAPPQGRPVRPHHGTETHISPSIPRFDIHERRTKMRRAVWAALGTGMFIIMLLTVSPGYAQPGCTLKTLNGRYLFS